VSKQNETKAVKYKKSVTTIRIYINTINYCVGYK